MVVVAAVVVVEGVVVVVDEVVEVVATKDIEEFWTVSMPEVYGKQFEGLAAGYHPYSPDSPPPACGNSPSTYKEMAGNAFYCPSGDFIAFEQPAEIAGGLIHK